MKLKVLILCCLLLWPGGAFAEAMPPNDQLVEVEAVAPARTDKSLRKLVILPFRTTKNSYAFIGGQRSYHQVAQLFRQKCVMAMAETGRFDILTGEDLDELLQANNLELSADTPVALQMEVGKVLGVDYLLTGTILDASEVQTPYLIQVTGEAGMRYTASFVVDYQVVAMATGQVKWADSVLVKLDDSTWQKMTDEIAPEQRYQLLFTKAAGDLTRNVMADIYPLRVVQVQDGGEVIVNHGGSLVAVGERFDVFLEQDEVIDPETGETLGAAEKWAATIKINRVTDKVSYATLIEGDLEHFSGKSICRPVEKKKARKRTPGRVSDVQPTIDGGVVLPFD